MKRVTLICFISLLGISTFAGDNIGGGGLGGLTDFFGVLCMIGFVIGLLVLLIAKFSGNRDE